MPRPKGSKNKKTKKKETKTPRTRQKKVAEKKVSEKKVEAKVDEKSPLRVFFMDDSLSLKEITTGTIFAIRNNKAFGIGIDPFNGTFDMIYGPHGKELTNESRQEIEKEGFKINISITYMQKLLGYIFSTPEDKLDKKLMSIKNDIKKNSRFYKILDLERAKD